MSKEEKRVQPTLKDNTPLFSAFEKGSTTVLPEDMIRNLAAHNT
jgi:hypothetical protein